MSDISTQAASAQPASQHTGKRPLRAAPPPDPEPVRLAADPRHRPAAVGDHVTATGEGREQRPGRQVSASLSRLKATFTGRNLYV